MLYFLSAPVETREYVGSLLVLFIGRLRQELR